MHAVSSKKELLEEEAEKIRRCRICKQNKSGLAVPGEGNPNAKIMFVGEAPGREESLTGRPFVGRSGKFLTKLIVLMGNVAAKGVLAKSFMVCEMHSKTLKEKGRYYFFTFHPAAALRFPRIRNLTEKDFRKLAKWFP